MHHMRSGRGRGAAPVVILVAALVVVVGTTGRTAADGVSLVFDAANYTLKTATLDGQTIECRAYEGIVYVARPVDIAYQSLNIYVPTAYFEGKAVGGFTAKTAPILLPNAVGGYMPARPGGLGPGPGGGNASLVALSKGYIVAAPGARGRTLRDAAGTFTGKAPAAIVDLKAAVRYLKFNDDRMPGDAKKIVSNGTSAGGALSALLGASGNHADFEPSLKALGAAHAPDDIFAVSAYCPITNLEHADMAYEWQFHGVNEFSRGRGGPGGPARGGDPGRADGPGGAGEPGRAGAPGRAAGPGGQATGTMTDEQIKLSALLHADFPAYVNGLDLKGPDGVALRLDANGNGSFKDYVKSWVIASAQKALAGGADLSALPWLTVANGKVTDLDFDRYVRFAGRMKVTPAFDSPALTSPENDSFGSDTTPARHFTRFGQEHSTARGTLAESGPIRQMNAMSYIGAPGAVTARHWRIRHGAVDRDTSLAIPVIMATALTNNGNAVDFAVPWGVGHGGNYDLDELFAWIARVCR